jgi:hypothetical protein
LFHPFLKEEEMKKSFLVTLVLGLVTLGVAASAFALEPFMIKESAGNSAPGPCALAASTDGSAANYEWYNLCSGYIWIFSAFVADEGVGTRFGGAGNEQVNASNRAKRSITYFRNVAPNYNQTVDIYLDDDNNGDGCPDGVLASDLNLDPGLRWNCSDFGVCFASDGAIVRAVHDGGSAPTIATDGPFTQTCDPVGSPGRAYYYGVGSAACLNWVGPTGRADVWLTWLIVDSATDCFNATESKSWGEIKGLYR